MNQVIVGYLFTGFFLMLLAYPWLRRLRPLRGLRLSLSYPLQAGLTSILVGGSLVILYFSWGLRSSFFAACRSCPLLTAGQGYDLAEIATQFPQLIFTHSATTIPIFILGCFIAGLIGRINFRLWPRTIFSSFLLAAVLPLCSCGVIPIVRAMLEQPHLHRRVVLVFLIATPILSPIVIVLSWGVLGVRYVLLRIVFTFILAILGGFIIGKLWGPPPQEREPPAELQGVKFQSLAVRLPFPLGTWRYILSLFRFIGLGLLLGSAFAVLLPGSFLKLFMQNNLGGLLAMASIGIPIHLCSGAEVLILSPFMQMGMPLGHALAFTISGAGICISSIPLLLKVVGRRVTFWLLLLFWVGAVLMGVLTNLISPFIGEEMEFL